jgi:hypothetical protein
MKLISPGYPIIVAWIIMIPGNGDRYDTEEGVWSIKDHAGMTNETLSGLVGSDYVACWQVNPDMDPREAMLPITVNGTILGPEHHARCGVPDDQANLVADHLAWLIGQRDYALTRCEAQGWTPTGWKAPPTKAEIERRRESKRIKS